MNACSLIWEAAGSPTMDGSILGACRTCGSSGSGLLFGDWVRDTFTDWDKLTAGDIVCHACQFCFTDRNDLLTKITRKDKPQRMRNYSHFVARGQWTPLSKGDKKRMRQILEDFPEVAVIAESGQKHIIFRARPNWWQFEELTLRPAPNELLAILAIVEELYAGFSKEEILTGRYIQHRVLAFGVPRWTALEGQVKAMRGAPILVLALFLAQKKEEVDDESGVGGQSPVANLARDARGLQNQVRPQRVAAIRRQHSQRGIHPEPGSLF